MEETGDAFVLYARRFGHGVGMSQRGAQWMASNLLYGAISLNNGRSVYSHPQFIPMPFSLANMSQELMREMCSGTFSL